MSEKRNTMMNVHYLLEHSNLPGPRGNLKLLYEFVESAHNEEIAACLKHITTEVNNSPEEFAGMCGVVAWSVRHKDDLPRVVSFLDKYAAHTSWRIREAVAMAIQEVAENNLHKMIGELHSFVGGSSFNKRALVAGLCEPKLLKNSETNIGILDILYNITESLNHNDKLDEGGTSLRKALGYGWSVVIVSQPAEGKRCFEGLFSLEGKHISWIIKENLKKKRLERMDKHWVEACRKNLGT